MHVWGLSDLGTSSMGQGRGASNTGTQGTQGYEWSLQISEVNARSTVVYRDKHFPESKTLPTNENTPQSPKYIPESNTCPRIQNTSQNVKTLPRIQNTSQNPKLFWILGCVLDFEKCFWILGSVLSLRAIVDISHLTREYVLVKQPTLPSLWFQHLHCLQCRPSSPR